MTGQVAIVTIAVLYGEAAALAERTGGHYMDQFTFAERATDWRGNNNIAESIFQLISELNRQGKTGSVVSMICDSGDRYLETYYSNDWLNQKGFDLTRYRENLEVFYSSGTMPD